MCAGGTGGSPDPRRGASCQHDLDGRGVGRGRRRASTAAPSGRATIGGWTSLGDGRRSARRDRHARARDARPAHLRDRPLQLPLHVLHAQGGLRAGLRVPAARPGPARSRRSNGSPASSVGLGVAEAAHHRRRAARPARPAATSSRCSRRSAGPTASPIDLTLTTNGSALARPGRAAGGRRAAAGHRQPRLARRRGVRRDERDRLPGRARARRHRRRARGRADAGQDQHGRPPRRQRGRASSRWPRGRARPGSSSGSSSTWTSATRTAGGSTRSCRPADIVETLARPMAGRAGRRRRTAARSPTAGATSTGAASSGSSPRSRRRSAATAPGPACPPTGSCTRACSRWTATTSGRSCARASRTRRSTAFVERIWLRRGDRYSELRSASTSALPKVEMFAMGG